MCIRDSCWKAEKNLKTTYGSECALTSLAVDEPLEYARLYLEGNLQTVSYTHLDVYKRQLQSHHLTHYSVCHFDRTD